MEDQCRSVDENNIVLEDEREDNYSTKGAATIIQRMFL